MTFGDHVDDKATELTDLFEMLNQSDKESVAEYWVVYYRLMAEHKLKKYGPESAMLFLEKNAKISEFTIHSIDRIQYPLLLVYCELAMKMPEFPDNFLLQIKLLLLSLSFADKWNRWRALSVLACYAGSKNWHKQAILFGKLACQDISLSLIHI